MFGGGKNSESAPFGGIAVSMLQGFMQDFGFMLFVIALVSIVVGQIALSIGLLVVLGFLYRNNLPAVSAQPQKKENIFDISV